MITETGKIIAIKEVQGVMIAQVECISKSACSSCNSHTSCGVGAVSEAFNNKAHRFDLPYKEGMEVDHSIELQISNGDLIKSASLIYLLPLLFFISSALVLKSFFNISEIGLIIISGLFALVGFIFTRLLAHRLFPNKPSKQLISTQFDD
ncbi:MAG: SoxR reducing system RseC family protein [Psychromonas sp.]